MGTWMTFIEADLRVAASDVPPMMDAIRNVIETADGLHGCDADAAEAAQTPVEAFAAWGLRVTVDGGGGIVALDFGDDGELKASGEDKLFHAIAPHVVEGSYIEAEVTRPPFRWVFHDGRVAIVEGRIVFPSVSDIGPTRWDQLVEQFQRLL